jgi:hypothetical protein
MNGRTPFLRSIIFSFASGTRRDPLSGRISLTSNGPAEPSELQLRACGSIR